MEQNRQTCDPAAMDSAGCMRLIEAIVRLAAEDYLRALRRLPRPGAAKTVRETTAFFRSDYFLRLTGADGKRILSKIKKEAGVK